MEAFIRNEAPQLVQRWTMTSPREAFFDSIITKISLQYLRENENELVLNIPTHLSVILVQYISITPEIIENELTKARIVQQRFELALSKVHTQKKNIQQENQIHIENNLKF